MADQAEKKAFPWHLGLHDAHCHPTDINSSLANLANMETHTLTLMATRISDQVLVHNAAKEHGDRVIPAFGHHPWFTHLVYDDAQFPNADKDPAIRKLHFRNVLQPPPEEADEETWLTGAGDVISLSALLAEQRMYLEQHPLALVGEVGLDKAFRIPEPWSGNLEERTLKRTEGSREGRRLAKQKVNIEHQKKILQAQMRLAGEFGRGVSVHGVQAHGVLFDFFQMLWKGHERPGKQKRKKNADNANTFATPFGNVEEKKPFPPRICLHSYSGSVENLKQYFSPKIPSDVYASFSIAVNFSNPQSPASAKAEEVIKWLPEDRLLIESDLHQAGEEMDLMMEQIARKVCQLRGWSLDEGLTRLAQNYETFVAIENGEQ
jgi:Tat protein secretion system quality control protein TatD with DNase activity